MGRYSFFLNRANSLDGFAEALNGGIFVDKSMLLDFVSSKIATKEKCLCVSRPRRFGKTMALEMMAAYFTRGIRADNLFYGLAIRETERYHRHLNNHNTIFINFNDYFEGCSHVSEGISLIAKRLIHDLAEAFPGTLESPFLEKEVDLPLALDMVQQKTGEKFIFLIDEWDCVFRFRKGEKKEQEEFLSFLRALFKDKSYVELVYMTGILPIKKYNTGSALNMFREYTILEPKRLGAFFGFTGEEAEKLAEKQGTVPLEELRLWYDGYYLDGLGEIYNPRSVVEALEEGRCNDYWNRTGGYTELEEYITLGFDGLDTAVTQLLAEERIPVNVLGFSNDLDSFQNRDEVITALIHLGYLTYKDGRVYIPNREIREEFGNTVRKLSWGIVSELLNRSRGLLKATLAMEAEQVAACLEDVHDGMQEFKEYNNEQTLKCVIHLAYYAAMDQYDLRFEQPSGKGVADCIMVPREPGMPGIVLELKYDSSASKALEQIREKQYTAFLPMYVREAILVGINYDKKEKKHQCLMEKVELSF